MIAESNEQPTITEAVDEKQENIGKLENLVADGQKALVTGDTSKAVDLLSEASHLADTLHGSSAPETFSAFLEYGRALIRWADEQNEIIRKDIQEDDESIDSEDSEAGPSTEVSEPDQPCDNGDAVELTGNEDSKAGPSTETGPSTEVSESDQPHDNGNAVESTKTGNEDSEAGQGEGDYSRLDDNDKILADAWSVTEIAKNICEKKLKEVSGKDEIRIWELNMSDALYSLGMISFESGRPEEGKAEFDKCLELKQRHLGDDDRELASIYHAVGGAYADLCKFALARSYFEKALDSIKKKMASLETNTDEKNLAEIEELNQLCKEIQERVEDAIESEKHVIEGGAKHDPATSIASGSKSVDEVNKGNMSDVPANDVSGLVKRRRLVDEADVGSAKRAKIE